MIGMSRAGTACYFYRNLQGDVTEIYDAAGTLKSYYIYDAYGNCTVYGSDKNVGTRNSIRYRGYYFDDETGFYCLGARYYCPEWRRFISPDEANYLNAKNANGLNLYCYCGNDPVNYTDSNGRSAVPVRIAYSELGCGEAPFAATTGFGQFLQSIGLIPVVMVHESQSAIDSSVMTFLFGNVTYTTTIQLNESNPLYFYFDLGGLSSGLESLDFNIGSGFDFQNGFGYSTYVSSDLGIGMSFQWNGNSTFGIGLSLAGGLSVTTGVINGNVTSETTLNIGWGSMGILFATVCAAALVPSMTVKAGAATALSACFVFMISTLT